MKVNHPFYPNIPITIRHLLSHIAGIETNLEEDLEHFKPNDEFTQTNLVIVTSKYLNNKLTWLSESPGNVTHYSNIGATLAALIVERITNISFEQYVQDKILECLGIDENEVAYRIKNFENRKKGLVEYYI
jgi:CubicO group peptidase (beta-lactamase class C family)